jgi:hypothetical protein
MPRGDRTGPEGMGPMTGRAAGYCAGYDRPGYMNDVPGRGYGMGRGGWGRGWRRRNWYQPPTRFGTAPGWAPPAAQPETETLKAQAEWLRTQLEAIEQRLTELDQER